MKTKKYIIVGNMWGGSEAIFYKILSYDECKHNVYNYAICFIDSIDDIDVMKLDDSIEVELNGYLYNEEVQIVFDTSEGAKSFIEDMKQNDEDTKNSSHCGYRAFGGDFQDVWVKEIEV